MLASEVEPEDVATLTLEYRDGQPVIIAGDGKVVPARLPIVNKFGQSVAHFDFGIDEPWVYTAVGIPCNVCMIPGGGRL
ncbi:hypothetical protein [Streptomyces lavendulae]|uniref:hypothetical protein n=1 Tax=Streptomyces lavendulae TaxID=1914 RepID=UPI00381ED4D4